MTTYLHRFALNVNDKFDKNIVSFGGYDGFPHFYMKKGHRIHYNRDKTITVATMCDRNLLDEARSLAMNYQYGPFSLALYVAEDVSVFFRNSSVKKDLMELIQSNFNNISNAYDIYVGLLFIRKSSIFYQSQNFTPSTSISWSLPSNPLRNLAEYQVQTAWVFNVDIDFLFYSDTFMNLDRYFFDAISVMNITEKTLFIVPAFEELAHEDKAVNFSYISKQKMLDYKKKQYVIPFMIKRYTKAQQCTQYNKWYKMQSHYTLGQCMNTRYEPWYIMNTTVSRMRKYQWDNTYIGREADKVSRLINLRHHCFKMVVMYDMFVIHVAKLHYNKSKDLDRKYFMKNVARLDQKTKMHIKDNKTCLCGNRDVICGAESLTHVYRRENLVNRKEGTKLKHVHKNIKLNFNMDKSGAIDKEEQQNALKTLGQSKKMKPVHKNHKFNFHKNHKFNWPK